MESALAYFPGPYPSKNAGIKTWPFNFMKWVNKGLEELAVDPVIENVDHRLKVYAQGAPAKVLVHTRGTAPQWAISMNFHHYDDAWMPNVVSRKDNPERLTNCQVQSGVLEEFMEKLLAPFAHHGVKFASVEVLTLDNINVKQSPTSVLQDPPPLSER